MDKHFSMLPSLELLKNVWIFAMSPSKLIKAIGAEEIEDIPPQDRTSRRWGNHRHQQRPQGSTNSRSNCR